MRRISPLVIACDVFALRCYRASLKFHYLSPPAVPERNLFGDWQDIHWFANCLSGWSNTVPERSRAPPLVEGLMVISFTSVPKNIFPGIDLRRPSATSRRMAVSVLLGFSSASRGSPHQMRIIVR
jgi:hypothetical protein